jgi:putative transposase
MDATGTAVRETQFCGCSQALLYNLRRPHQALANRTPIAIWRDGVTGEFGQKAVDMTLRLDNAGALPTCPQQQQKVA